MANKYCIGTGNWSSDTIWSTSSGGANDTSHPTASDAVFLDDHSGNLTVDAGAAGLSLDCTTSGIYAGTLAMGTATLTISGSVTLSSSMTITGTTGTLLVNATGTLTSNGKTWPVRLELGGTSQIYTLADAWATTGWFKTSGSTACTINGFSITSAGGLTFNNSETTGTTTFTITGGTLGCQGTARVATTLAGDVTFAGGANAPFYRGTTFTRSSGTITTTGSVPTFRNCTLNTSGMTFDTIIIRGGSTNEDTTLTSALSATTLQLYKSQQSFVGAFGFTVGTLTKAIFDSRWETRLTPGNTYTVTANLNLPATAVGLGLSLLSTTSSDATLNLQVGASQTLNYVNATHIDSSGGQTIYSDGTITSCVNWQAPATTGTISAVQNVTP